MLVPFDQPEKIRFNQPTKWDSKSSTNTAILACAQSIVELKSLAEILQMKGRQAHSGEALAKSETFRQ